MYYSTFGKPKKVSNPLMDKMVVFASDFLELDNDITVDFEDDFEETAGWCSYDEDGVTIGINPTMSRTEICKTLFHEMVHAKQYVRGDLISGVGNKPSRWKGKYVIAVQNYWDLPWEKEAYETENAMWDIFSTEVLKKRLR